MLIACAGLTSLLALRFMSQVFEESRNLCLGVASRGIDWNSLGPAGSIQILLRLLGHLFTNLLQRSESIAQAMCARGFVGADSHKLYLTNTQPTSKRLDIIAILLLVVMVVVVNVAPM